MQQTEIVIIKQREEVKGVWEEKNIHPEEQMKQTGPLPKEHSSLFIPWRTEVFLARKETAVG